MDWEYRIKSTSNFDVVSYVPGKYNQAWGMVQYIEVWYIDGNWYIEIKYNHLYLILFIICN
jgi:hypothetical protein